QKDPKCWRVAVAAAGRACSVAGVGPTHLRAQSEALSARRTDTPTRVAERMGSRCSTRPSRVPARVRQLRVPARWLAVARERGAKPGPARRSSAPRAGLFTLRPLSANIRIIGLAHQGAGPGLLQRPSALGLAGAKDLTADAPPWAQSAGAV